MTYTITPADKTTITMKALNTRIANQERHLASVTGELEAAYIELERLRRELARAKREIEYREEEAK
jgi:septal ring factor EnvC (AmiA/AmiB activator)